ncbi:uncharacterized protein J3D65DRAFT_636031 [Phyllosticta citribraziliensis]|uniref:Uncharacterized protein n=1 Tax=Phyllosticta citribraziliensis TaxID=989973 RepID=A0ABR1LAB5_9PEZI
MDFSSRSHKLWAMALILALVAFLLLGNMGPGQVEQTLDKRGAPEGEADGWKHVWGSMAAKLKHTLHKRGNDNDKDKDNDNGGYADAVDYILEGHTTLQNAWGTVPNEFNDQQEVAMRKIPGPKTEPPFEPCNRKDWVMWLSFGASHEEFWSHRDARDVSCLKDADWKSNGCAPLYNRPGLWPGIVWDFTVACQRKDFARLNLPDFRSAFRQEMGSMVKFHPFIKQRFAKDAIHMCTKQHYNRPLMDSEFGDIVSESKKRCLGYAWWMVKWLKDGNFKSGKLPLEEILTWIHT